MHRPAGARAARPAPAVATLLALFVLRATVGCERQDSPEHVADQFVDAYFRRMDQEAARIHTAFGATRMLEAELALAEEVRKQGYTPDQAGAFVTWQRGEATPRDARMRIPYVIRVRGTGHDRFQDADVELAQVEGSWKVVRLGLTPRP